MLKQLPVLKKIRIQSLKDYLKHEPRIITDLCEESPFRRFAIMHGTGNEPSALYWIPSEHASLEDFTVLYKVFRILPFEGDHEAGMTSTIILSYLAPYALERGIALHMISDYDFDYLLVEPSDELQITSAIESFFTLLDHETLPFLI